MPLHLLPKKSWHVYNADNVARVRQDEARARAAEQKEDERIQRKLAAKRLALLRGVEYKSPTPSPPPPSLTEQGDHLLQRDDSKRRQRRRRGEDDTDRDIRLARADVAAAEKARENLSASDSKRKRQHEGDDGDLVDDRGHLQLIPAPKREGEQQPQPSKKSRKERDNSKEDVNVGGMRFKDAVGYSNASSGRGKPWYTSSASRSAAEHQSSTSILSGMPEKDVWGNEDPRRKEREMNRAVSNDPFAVMQKAQRQLKQSAKDREDWEKKRDAETRSQRGEERSDRDERKRSRSSREKDDDGLEGFSLDDSHRKSEKDERKHRRHHRHHHHHRTHRPEHAH